MIELEFYSYWENAWVRYINDYFKDKNDFKINWNIGAKFIVPEEYNKKIGVFMWANEHAEIATRSKIKFYKKIIVFVRSYEIFSGLVGKINWKNVDLAVFCNKSFNDMFGSKLPCKSVYIPNAVDVDEWEKQEHYRGFNIGMVCSLNSKKGINLIPQVIYKLNQIDDRYNISIAGSAQENRHIIYVNNLLSKMGLKHKVVSYGQISDVRNWLDDKDYLLTTSVTEGHPNNVLEAMSVGIKPVIHSWIGAEYNFPDHLIWKSIDEAIKIITEIEYNSDYYRRYVTQRYSHKNVYRILEDYFIKVNNGEV